MYNNNWNWFYNFLKNLTFFFFKIWNMKRIMVSDRMTTKVTRTICIFFIFNNNYDIIILNWSRIHDRCWDCWDNVLRCEGRWDLRFLWQFIVVNSHVFMTFSPRVHIKVAVGPFFVSRLHFAWSHSGCPRYPYLVLFMIPPVSGISNNNNYCIITTISLGVIKSFDITHSFDTITLQYTIVHK